METDTINNLVNCVTTKEMTPLEVATAMSQLVDKLESKNLGIGVWEGTVTGDISGNRYEGKHLGVFNNNSLVALFGPHGDAESEAAAALFVLAVKNADLLKNTLGAK